MRVVDPGHIYAVGVLDDDREASEIPLIFVKREGTGYPGNVGHHPGTTSQEVLRALIERGEYVNSQKPCFETEAATELMKAALALLEIRAARRHGRSLEAQTVGQIVRGATCPICGHVGCQRTCR